MEANGRYSIDAEKFRRRRLALELTIRALAEKAQTSHDAIVAFERGVRRPRKDLFYRLVAALDVQPADLLKDRNDGG